MEANRRNILLKISYALMAVFYIYLALCIPYCHDDWDWGLAIGMRQWLEASLNCRYVGNFFVVIMTRNEIVKTIVIAFTLFIIPVTISEMSGKKEKLGLYLFANLLLLIVPQLLWQQTHGWVSGFANYVISAALTLFLIMMMEKSIKRTTPWYYLLVPLAVAQSLFIENLAAYSTLAFLAFTIICGIKTRKVNFFHIAMTLASIGGTVIMFSNQLYSDLLEKGVALDGIRDLTFDVKADTGEIIETLLNRFYYELFMPFFYDYRIVLSVMTGGLVFGGVMGDKRRLASAAVPYICAISFCVFSFFADLEKGDMLKLAVLATMFFVMTAVIISVVFVRNRGKMLFLWISIPAILVPLAAADDNGPRLFYLCYIFAALIAVLAIPELSKVPKRVFGALAAVGLTVFVVFYVRIYTEIYDVTIERGEMIEYAIENDFQAVLIKKDPNKYWWGRNPQSEERVEFFREFYGIPKGMEIVFEE